MQINLTFGVLFLERADKSMCSDIKQNPLLRILGGAGLYGQTNILKFSRRESGHHFSVVDQMNRC